MIKTILRILIGLIFLSTGIIHFVKAHELAVYVPIPYGSVQFVYFIGFITVFASFGIIVNKYLQASLITLAITMASTAILVQIPIFIREREYILRVIGISNLIKLSLAIALLLMAFPFKKKSK